MGFHTQIRRWATGAALAALAVAFAWHSATHPRVLRTGDRLASLPVLSLDGTASEARTPGRAQIINIFATWCPPCREEMPAIKQLALEVQARAIDVVGVDQQESPAAVERFARTFAIPYPLYIDRSNITHDRLGARIIPTTIFVDAQGVIRWQHSGPLTPADWRSLGVLVASVQ